MPAPNGMHSASPRSPGTALPALGNGASSSDRRPFVLTPRVVDIRPKRSMKTYTVAADVLFAFDSATLSPDAANVLDDVVQTLKKERAAKVTVTGYTDSIGTVSHNQSLSERRAKVVAQFLKGRVSNPTYKSIGRGERHPVAANKLRNGHGMTIPPAAARTVASPSPTPSPSETPMTAHLRPTEGAAASARAARPWARTAPSPRRQDWSSPYGSLGRRSRVLPE